MADVNEMCAALREATERGTLSAFAFHFAQVIGRLAGSAEAAGVAGTGADAVLAAALAAENTVAGKNVCLNFCDNELPAALEAFIAFLLTKDISVSALRSTLLALRSTPLAAAPNTPLVLEDGRLYLQRYFLLENQIAGTLRRRADTPRTTPPEPEQIRARTRLALDEAQVAAVSAALAGDLCVITGAPGTGKTTIVAVVLAALLAEKPDLRIRLCAPTGKAAARLREAITGESAALAALEAETVHRLLRFNPSKNGFEHDAGNPFAADVLVADEISMIDFPLFAALLDAAPAHCRLLLLGDADQLAAVETGAVLAAVCDAWKELPAAPLARLTRSHRFPDGSGIARLKDAINAGDADAAWEIVNSGKSENAGGAGATGTVCIAPAVRFGGELETRIAAKLRSLPFREYTDAPDIAEAFQRFESFRILCATRNGAAGVAAANAAVQCALGIATYGHGYPVMVTENDYAHGLFNGDIGLCWRTGTAAGTGTAIYFPASEGGYRCFAQSELPAHEPVFAMTVHKSQGSGFGEVLLLLPPATNPILTRELLYTGLTRARRHCEFWADEPVFKHAVASPTRRHSGLAEKLALPAASLTQPSQTRSPADAEPAG